MIGLTISYAIIAFHLPEYIHPNQLNNVGLYVKKSNDLYDYIFGSSMIIHFVFSIYYLRNCNLGESDFIIIFAVSGVLTISCLLVTENILNIISIYNIQHNKIDKVKIISKRSYTGQSGKTQTVTYFYTVRYEDGEERTIEMYKPTSYGFWSRLKEGTSISIYHYKGRLSNVEQFINETKR